MTSFRGKVMAPRNTTSFLLDDIEARAEMEREVGFIYELTTLSPIQNRLYFFLFHFLRC